MAFTQSRLQRYDFFRVFASFFKEKRQNKDTGSLSTRYHPIGIKEE